MTGWHIDALNHRARYRAAPGTGLCVRVVPSAGGWRWELLSRPADAGGVPYWRLPVVRRGRDYRRRGDAMVAATEALEREAA